MRLLVITPTDVVVDRDVDYVRAEDSSGAFGIAPGHADLLTTLEICVVRWRDLHNTEHYVAVRGGLLRVRAGQVVEIATREAIVSDDLGQLRGQVIVAMRNKLETELSARAGALRLEHAAIRQISRYLRPADQPIRTTTPKSAP
jgi:F-type H+-transporting ATPase subunit epsilon